MTQTTSTPDREQFASAITLVGAARQWLADGDPTAANRCLEIAIKRLDAVFIVYAAAPDLLEALRQIEQIAEPNGRKTRIGIMARAAIAQARPPKAGERR